MLSLATMIEDSRHNHPERVALVQGDRHLTYREVGEQARRLAYHLTERGIGPGDRVAVACPNLVDFPITYYSILKAGAVVVPMNVLMKADEIRSYLTDYSAKALICFAGTSDLDLGVQGRAAFDAVNTCEHFILIGEARPARSSSARCASGR